MVICCSLGTSSSLVCGWLKKTTLPDKLCCPLHTRLFVKHSVKLWAFCVLEIGVNLLVGTESGLMLLDRSGQGKVYPLINRRRFQQMDVLEGLNVLVTISGKRVFGEGRPPALFKNVALAGTELE